MSTTIQIKRSSTASGVPLSTDLAVGELAVNLADKRLFTKQSDGTIIELSTNPTDLDAATLRIDGVEITASATELNKLDGFTGSTTELNILDGLTATTIELNTLDGITASTAELNKLDGYTGVAADLNYAKDLRATGVTTTEFNKLDGLTATTTELNYTDGVTSNIQTQLNGKATSAQGALADSAVQPDDNVSFGTGDFSGDVDVTGTVTADGLTVDGQGRIEESGAAARFTIARTDAANSAESASLDLMENSTTGLLFGEANAFGYRLEVDGSTNKFNIISGNQTTTGKRFSIDRDLGDVSFYEDTGTTAKMVWDASAENLNITGQKDSTSLTLSASLVTVGGGTLADYNQIYFNNTSGVGDAYIRHWANAHNDGKSALTFGTSETGTVTERMRIDSTGKVGIGESDPSGYWSQASDLVLGGTGNRGVTIKSASAGNGRLVFTDTKSSTAGLNDGGMISYGHSTDVMTFQTNGSEAARITSAGNVGIGTSSPSYPLHISSTLGFPVLIERTNSADAGIRFKDSTTTDADSVRLGAKGDGLQILTGGSDSVLIDSAGKVGIGTASPSSVLHARGAGNPTLTIDGSDAAYTSFLKLKAAGGGGSVIRAEGGSNLLIFQTGGNNERARIDSSGNLLVGTTSESNWETVAGFRTRPSGSTTVTRSSAPALYVNRLSNDGALAEFRKDGSTVGSIASDSGNILQLNSGGNDKGVFLARNGVNVVGFAPNEANVFRSASDGVCDLGKSDRRFKDLYLSGGVITSSDYRLKEDIQPMQSYADTVKQMNLVNFAWKESGEREDGFIAHELQALVPSAVRGDKDAVNEDGEAQYQGVDPLKLIPVLTKALQEALERIETLENK